MIKPSEKIEQTKINPHEKLQFDKLVGYIGYSFSILPDKRRGFNKTYVMQDAALSAFSVFFTQSPSFLAYQTQMQETKGKNNANSLFQVEDIPSDNQIRNMLDPVPPSTLNHVYEYVHEQRMVAKKEARSD